MENRIRRGLGWNRNEKKISRILRSRLFSMTRTMDARGALPEGGPTTIITQPSHANWLTPGEIGRTLTIAPISTLGRMLQ